MGIEANTFESVTINNVNAKTAGFSEKVGDYLRNSWGIISLKLTADGKNYETTEETINKDSDLYRVCGGLSDRKNVMIKLRTCNKCGLEWRREADYLSFLDESDELKNNVVYKSEDYYDTDTVVDLCIFDDKGLRCPVDPYLPGADSVINIKEWYCYTPEIAVFAEEPIDDEKLHDTVVENLLFLLTSVCGYSDNEAGDAIEDDWDGFCLVSVGGSLRFSADRIDALIDCLSSILGETKIYDAVIFTLEINAVPDGDNDYEFAVISIKNRGNEIIVESVKV